VAERSLIFDAQTINEGDWQNMVRRFLATGVITGSLNQLTVSADGSALSVSVATGDAFVEGFFYRNDAAKAVALAAADSSFPRIDTIVARLDRVANTVLVDKVTGTPASAGAPTPVAPTLTQTDSLFELPLANVTVPAAAGVIVAEDVTDRRAFVKNLTEAAGNAAYVAKVGDTLTGKLLLASGLAGNKLGFDASPLTGLDLANPGEGGLVADDGAGASAYAVRWTKDQVRVVPGGTVAAPGLAFFLDEATGLARSAASHLDLVGGGQGIAQAAGVSATDKRFQPYADNAIKLGLSTRRWTEVYAVNGTIQTSDVEAKEDVAPVEPEAALARVKRVADEATITFRWPDGTRSHAGFDAEKIGEIHGSATAAFIDPSIEAQRRVNPHAAGTDEHEEFEADTAEMLTAPKGVRYSEMLPDLYAALAAQQAQIEALTARVAALEAR
jgi:hypothetical protein